MTGIAKTSRRHTGARWLRPAPDTTVPAVTEWRRAVAAFMSIGWTTDQWTALHAFFADRETPTGGPAVAHWLRTPPARFVIPITPAMVKDLNARHGEQTAQVLAAMAAGASERFCVAFLNPGWDISTHVSVLDGWAQAAAIDLAEHDAVGWAATDYLGCRRGPTVHGLPSASRAQLTVRVSTWVNYFGPGAYLYVLGGFDLDEAVAMRDAGTSPTPDQLRVMVALAGVILPPGV